MPTSQPPVKVEEYKADWSNKEWTAILAKALEDHGQELLAANPRDAKDFCKNFQSVDKKQFYIMLISGLARFESGFKPETKYTEDKKDSKGNPVVSRGLLQISIESAKSYGCHLPSNENSLHDPEKNLECGVRILSRWIPKDGVIRGSYRSNEDTTWLGAARYWSPFRKDYRVEALRLLTNRLQGCQ